MRINPELWWLGMIWRLVIVRRSYVRIIHLSTVTALAVGGLAQRANRGSGEQAEFQQPPADGPRIVYGDDGCSLSRGKPAQACEVGVHAPWVARMKLVFI